MAQPTTTLRMCVLCTEMCAKLTALGYSSVDVLIDDVRNHSQQHLRQFLSTVEPSRRAKQLSSQMEAFTEGG